MRLLTKELTRTAAMFFLAGLLVLTGCGKLEQGKAGIIRPSVQAAETKASITTTDGLKTAGSFFMYAYADAQYSDNEIASGKGSASDPYDAGLYFSENVDYSGGDWATANEHKWINKVNLSFWSYAPVSASGTRSITAPGPAATSMSFTYTVNSTVASQDDLLFAYNSEMRVYDSDGNYKTSECTGTDSDDDMHVTFHHALSCIRFAVSPDDDTYATSFGIRKISLKNIHNSGSCVFTGASNSFAWTLGTGADTFELSLMTGSGSTKFTSCPTGWTSSVFGGSKNLYTMDESFFMIPQTVASTSDPVIEIVFDDGTTGGLTRTVSLADAVWLPDHYYTYKIGITEAGIIKLNMEIGEFKKGEEKEMLFE